ncbi:MAG: hypothetical protein SPK67_06000 [Synergistales bacterium]|nr:hypothetical protein [Synergistales bacterium]MDY6401831.1 hypothetical protein [Synergistales bacterium]MDY6403845.1 hypothetical protein [Synergistales bacterium]MDY6425797.1 hypothetical protein [Synergistales bacterium]MDY6432384.1 hypothetical protein [Synergistales bacterium]
MKRVKWLLLLCAFVFLWSSPGASADGEITTLENLKIALNTDGTITLGGNITTTEALVVDTGKTITIDLNGHNITNTATAVFINKGKLTIKGNGTVLASAGTKNDGYAAVANTPDALCYLQGGTYESKAWYVIKNLGVMSIDGTVTVQKPNDSSEDTSSLIANGWYGNSDRVDGNGSAGDSTKYSATDNKAKLTIKNGNFSGKSGAKSMSTIKNDDYGYLYIYDGKFDSTTNTGTSNAATLLNWNVAHIYGGTFTGQYPISNGAYNNSGDQGLITIEGGTFTGTSSLNGKGDGGDGKGKVTITGGFFSGDIVSFDTSGGYTFEISGGVFTKDPSTYLAKDAENNPTAYMLKLSDSTYPFGVSSKDVAVTITGTPENFTKTYDESGVELKATVTPEKIEGYTVPYTYVWTKGSETTSLGTAATYTTGVNVADKGTYKCTVTYNEDENKEASQDVTINKATPTYTAPTGLTSTYGKTLADVTLPTASNGTWAWSDATTTSVGNAGTNTFKAQFTPSDTENYDTPAAVDVSITVAKAKATVDTAPKEKTLTYTGSAQALVEAGKATGGTLQYAVGTTAGTYSSEIPTGTDAGSYTVWYKAAGTDNYDESEAKSLTVTIAKVTPTVTAPTAATGLTYNGSAQALVTTGSTTGGTLEYSTDGTNYGTSIPTGTNAGSYTVSYRVTGGTNYNDVAAASVTATIAKAPASEITTQVGGTTTGTATTTNGKTNTKTSKTTTFTLGSGTGAGTMSADVAITTEEKLATRVGDTFSTVVAVDTVLNGNKDFNQYAYSMDIVGLPSWITATGELTSSDTNAAGKTYHHEFTLKGTPAEAAEATSIAFTAWVTLSSDNYSSALKASADKSVEVAVAARPVPSVAPVLRIVDASEDKSLIITADVTNGSVTLDPDIIVEATAGTNFVWIVSGDLPKYLTATSTDKTLTISGYISDDLIAYSIVVIASNDVGSDSVKISFNVYKAEIDDTGAVTVTITSEDIEKIKETKGSDELTLSDVVDMTALNETLASSGGALKLSNGITTLEGISALSNLTTLDLSEVKTLTTTSLTADNLGSTTEIKIGENNTSITTVDLSGSKVETVTMQKSSVQTLTLGSSVKTVDAKDSANLTAIDFSQSTNVQTVNISGTQVASADLSNCTELVSFSFDVAPGGGTESAGALQTLKLPETSDKLENLAVRGNQLLWLSLGSSKYPNLKNINVRGQRRGGLSIKMAFDFFEFLWNLYQQSLYENEADYEEYTEGAEMPFDVTQISSDITYVASDDNSTQTATITNGKVNFIKTPKNFKYEYDTGFRRSGRTASTGSFITAEDEDEENGNMDVTIETGSVTGSAGGLESSSGGGCDAGFSYGALSALMLVFATLKKRR